MGDGWWKGLLGYFFMVSRLILPDYFQFVMATLQSGLSSSPVLVQPLFISLATCCVSLHGNNSPNNNSWWLIKVIDSFIHSFVRSFARSLASITSNTGINMKTVYVVMQNNKLLILLYNQTANYQFLQTTQLIVDSDMIEAWNFIQKSLSTQKVVLIIPVIAHRDVELPSPITFGNIMVNFRTSFFVDYTDSNSYLYRHEINLSKSFKTCSSYSTLFPLLFRLH